MPSAEPRRRRTRGAVLLLLAVSAGTLAASSVRDRLDAVESQTGPLVPVVVASRDLDAQERLSGRRINSLLEIRQVPSRFAPADALASTDEALGLRTAVPVAAGSYLTAGQLAAEDGSEAAPGPPLERGERAIEVRVAGVQPEALGAGARVDVLVTNEGQAGAGRTVVALEDVELLDARPAEPAEGEEAGASATAVATLRVHARDAVYLTAAQSFAREVRVLVRPPGDRRRMGRTAAGV